MLDSQTCYVIIHTPGPRWQKGLSFRQQPGITEHALHYQEIFKEGKLALGGPFPNSDRGGMMVAMPEVSPEELAAFAEKDPAVQKGLLTYEVVEWFLPMNRVIDMPAEPSC